MGRPSPILRRGATLALIAGLSALAATSDPLAATASSNPDAETIRGAQTSPELAYGLPVAAISVRLDGATGDAKADAELVQRVETIAGTINNVPLQRFVLDGMLQKIRNADGVASASVAAFASIPPGRVVLTFTVVPGRAAQTRAAERTGALATGSAADLPLLYQDDRSLFKLILNGGVGGYVTSNPFFGYGDLFTRGNKAARHPAPRGTTAWNEAYIEPGIGGIGRLGDTPLYAYGSVTYLESASWGQDIYDSGTRYHGAFEQAYAGLIVDLPGPGHAINVSAGRQTYQLRQGFLISKIPGSTNLGQLAALWLGPRLAFDQTALATYKNGPFTAEGVLLQPTEYPGMETGTRIAGATVAYDDGRIVDAALTYLEVPRSSKPYFAPDGSVLATREGLRTISPSIWLTRLFGTEGLWFKAEFAYQTHDRIDMGAYAYALWPGYRADDLPWKPGISYRYAYFSGDNPATAKYERYDPLLSGGQNNYVPGMLLSSVLVNANMRSQRLSLTANPTEQIGLTFEYNVHRAVQLNNQGGIGPLQQLSSRDLAQEADLFVSVYVGKNLYIQGVLAAATPGAAIKDAVGGNASNWYAAQLSAYLFF
ncbi:MAG: alginate export family protein [Burkholderiales bacterium]